jgi:fatty-acyl-CoA synthase
MTAAINAYELDLERNGANYVALSPLSFLSRAALVYANKTAVIYGNLRYSYAAFYQRCRRLASALARHGIGRGDTVAVMLPNVPATLEAHYGVPMLGAVLNTLNVRLDATAIAFMLKHGQAKVLLTDPEFSPIIAKALAELEHKPLVVDVLDPAFEGGQRLGTLTYEELLNEGDPEFSWSLPQDEWQAIALNYTSGTTGDPKGVVYHHRGAYLNALGNAFVYRFDDQSVYLWTLPMFHCNGWTCTWGVTAAGGAHVCLRKVVPAQVFRMIDEHRVTHLCGAPTVLSMLIHAPDEDKRHFAHKVTLATGGSSPPTAVLAAMEAMGFHIIHAYGLTEIYGTNVYCAEQPEWAALPLPQRAAKMARQGVAFPTLHDMMVADPDTMQPVPRDGRTVGEVMMRGASVMKGYLKNPGATADAFAGGWFHSGDLAVWHPDGYVDIRDRSKDIIISGGENISSVEVEEVLYRHPAVMEAAVVAKPDEKWGETPCAFVTLRPTATTVTAAELIAYCRAHLAHFKAPRHVIFGPLPKTATGKIQKYALRQRAKDL